MKVDASSFSIRAMDVQVADIGGELDVVVALRVHDPSALNDLIHTTRVRMSAELARRPRAELVRDAVRTALMAYADAQVTYDGERHGPTPKQLEFAPFV